VTCEGTSAFLKSARRCSGTWGHIPVTRIALIVSTTRPSPTAGVRGDAFARRADGHALETFLVPSAYELPQAAKRAAESGRFAAVVFGMSHQRRNAAFRLHCPAAAAESCTRRRALACPLLGLLDEHRGEAVARSAPPKRDAKPPSQPWRWCVYMSCRQHRTMGRVVTGSRRRAGAALRILYFGKSAAGAALR
jgi:hypothetical protein